MSRHRFFLTESFPAPGEGVVLRAPLSEADVHHAVRALRLRVGEEIDLVEPGGATWRVRAATVDDEGLMVEILSAVERADEPDVTLIFGVLKGSKNDDVVEGAVEVGVSGLVPVLFERSVVKLDAEKRVGRGERWRRVAQAAAKQAKRSRIPEVSDPVSGAEISALLRGFDVVLVAWEEASSGGIAAHLADLMVAEDARVAVVVGPEGGLSAGEVALMQADGAIPCTLGPTILRAETAGVVAAALVVHELGGLGGRR